MARTLEFLFDFASPNGYFAYRARPPILARTGAKLAITPVLLGGLFKATGNQAPMIAFAGVKGKLAYDTLEIRRFIGRHGLAKFKMNPHFPVNTLALMRGGDISGAAWNVAASVGLCMLAVWLGALAAGSLSALKAG